MENFKAYLITIEGGAKEKEIRRFTIDSDVATNFVYLREKLQCIFPILRGKRFTVTWKDIEGDPITISSDEELRIALQESPQSTNHKLFIILESDESSNAYIQPEEVVGILHHNVICDGCEKDVVGFRYKCMECPDYDLCSKCEARGMHSAHCMLRIAEPLQWSSRYGKRLAHHMKKFIRNSSQYNGREETAQECPVMKERHRRHRGPNCGSNSIIETLVDFLNDAPSYTNAYPTKSNVSKPPETAAEATASCNETQSQGKKPETNQPMDLFTIIEDTIAPVLNNLGVNINLKMKNDDKPDEKPGKKPDEKPGKKPEEKLDKKPEKKTDPKPDNAPTKQADSKETSTINDKSDKSSDDDDWTILNKEKTSDPDASAVTQGCPLPEKRSLAESFPSPCPSSSSQSTNETTPQEVVTPSAPEKEPSNENLYPSLPQPMPTQAAARQPTNMKHIYHTDPKIQSAVISMMDMGFSNEGDWLTHLLVLKNGNVEEVLDMLSPVGM